jgi:hypothetical protein
MPWDLEYIPFIKGHQRVITDNKGKGLEFPQSQEGPQPGKTRLFITVK